MSESLTPPPTLPAARTPRATYRLQLHAGFDFAAARAIVAYLVDLGVSHVYLSPILQAAAGSTHGYDVVDHQRVNRELGGEEAFSALVDALHAAGLGILLDIVPNHMAITGSENTWWWDVLENGPASRYASYFDVDWDPPEAKLRNVVLMPILGDHYGRVLEAGEITLQRDGGSFQIHYYDHALPVAPRSLDTLLEIAAARAGSDELASIATAFGRLPHSTATDAASVLERHRDKEVLRTRVGELCERDDAIAKAIDGVIEDWNRDPDALDALLERQNYRLAFWRTAARELDYRRFFDITDLIGLRVERDDVFDDTHVRIREWLREGAVDGVRVDHVDGLREPRQYLERLASLRGDGEQPWVVVEKILIGSEQLRATWPVHGTTGYEFTNLVTGVLCDPAGEPGLRALEEEVAGEAPDFATVERDARAMILHTVLAADVSRITAWVARVCEQHRRYRDYTRHDLTDAAREIVASFPVYRTYVDTAGAAPEDDAVVRSAIDGALARRPDLDRELCSFLGDVLTGRVRDGDAFETALRFQQLTGPAMAKGVEDTAFYRFPRLVARNEVGGDPAVLAVGVEEFHAANAARARQWPHALVATATHDTKRGEDVRARLCVLSEMPDAWAEAVRSWEAQTSSWRHGPWPDAPTRLLLWQTLVGAWPIDASRISTYMEKAVREAKVHTSWTDPDESYESAVREFAQRATTDRGVVAGIAAFVESIDGSARRNGLVQLVLKLTVPGVCDIYQGTELWDNSLVDPDNRRPVDYAERRALLEAGDAAGHPKLRTMARLLHLRREHPEWLGPRAPYEALDVSGEAADHVVAFSRGAGLAVVAGRWWHRLEQRGGFGDTTVTLPGRGAVLVRDLLGTEPAAVITPE